MDSAFGRRHESNSRFASYDRHSVGQLSNDREGLEGSKRNRDSVSSRNDLNINIDGRQRMDTAELGTSDEHRWFVPVILGFSGVRHFASVLHRQSSRNAVSASLASKTVIIRLLVLHPSRPSRLLIGPRIEPR